MFTINRILVYSPVEGENLKAVTQAVALARPYGASIKVLRVLDEGCRLNSWKPQKADSGPPWWTG